MRNWSPCLARGRIHPLWWLAPAAIALRLLLFLGRGDYVAFDEAWYLLLGRNLWAGEGFTLSGLTHIALSPLFPVLAGVLDLLLNDPIWAGRTVAALAAGLLVIPCWSIFRRLAGRKTALLGCGLVAVMPSLAPFVAPYWVGWDLWVGAEPVLHLFLFSGIALFLRALERGRLADWALAGLAFALAYLARPEAVIPFGLLALPAVAIPLVRRAPRAVPAAAAFGLAFVLAAAPYWLYLHDAMGRWALTGRGVEVALPTGGARSSSESRGDGAGAATTIERMLWDGETGPYVRNLYSLAPSGTRLASTYWGVPPRERTGTASPALPALGHPPAASDGQAVPVGPATAASSLAETSAKAAAPMEDPLRQRPERAAPPKWKGLAMYARTLGMIAPWFLWPLIIAGLAVPGPTRRCTELLAVGPLFAAGILIAGIVAIDPRTQLFLAPVLAFYAARGIRIFGIALDRRLPRSQFRRGFATATLAGVALVVLLGMDARRLYLSATVGSAHHLLGSENRRAGEGLGRIVPEGEPIMSWHPAVALHARRDWRVLPLGSFAEIVRYAAAIDCEYVVLSVYNPSPLTMEQMPREYLIIRVTPEVAGAEKYRIDVTETKGNYAIGQLRPA